MSTARSAQASWAAVAPLVGVRVAVFYNKIHARLLGPLIAATDQPPAPIELRPGARAINPVIRDHTDNPRLGTAA